MSEAIRLARVSVKGGFNFFYGLVISTIMSAVKDAMKSLYRLFVRWD